LPVAAKRKQGVGDQWNGKLPPTGKLMLTVLGAIAQFEREMMPERQNGIAEAL
jgi:hypothetical protein